MKKFIIADGGGSKTKYILIDEEKNTLATITGPGTNPVHVGVEMARQSLEEHIKALLVQSGTRPEKISAAALFVPVLWRHCARLDSFPFPCPILSDTEAAMWAALGDEEGLVVLSGTGSFVKGRCADEQLLVGGWGAAFGDEGSGYALGIAALKHVTRLYDACLGEDELCRSIMVHYDIDSLDKLKARQKEPDMLKAVNIAALCPLVERAAEKGCRAALDIIETQGKALAEQARICASRLGLDMFATFKVALIGGVMTNNPRIRAGFIEALREHFPNANIFLSQREPIEGAKDYVLARPTAL